MYKISSAATIVSVYIFKLHLTKHPFPNASDCGHHSMGMLFTWHHLCCVIK